MGLPHLSRAWGAVGWDASGEDVVVVLDCLSVWVLMMLAVDDFDNLSD